MSDKNKYPKKIYDGEKISFEEFALACASEFIDPYLREEDRFPYEGLPKFAEVDQFHYDQLEKYKKAFKEAEEMTLEDAERLSEEDFASKVGRYSKSAREDKDRVANYEALVEKVLAWEPPTIEHVLLKRTMRTKLKEMVDYESAAEVNEFFLKDLKKLSAEEYKETTLVMAELNLKHSIEKLKTEEAAVKNINKWIKKLYESLGIEVDTEKD